MKIRVLMCIAALSLLLYGCHHYTNPSVDRAIVTQIVISGQTADGPIHRYYNSPDKMRQVLLYIRKASVGFHAQVDPDTVDGPSVSISTVSVDNTRKVYHQKSNEFFQTEAGVWQQLDPEAGAGLWELIRQLPSDPQ